MIRLAFLILSAVMLVGCSSSGQTATEHASTPPADLALTVGEGGGFTGQWTGFEVVAGGGVTRLSGRTLGETRTASHGLSDAAMASLWALLNTSDILHRTPLDQPGNLTRSLTVTANGSTRQFRWVPSGTEVSDLDRVYRECVALISAPGDQ